MSRDRADMAADGRGDDGGGAAGRGAAWGVRNATVSFGAVKALDDVSLEVGPGEIVAVVGGDGAGKSTLLRALVGRVALDAGSVHAPPKEGIGYLSATASGWLSLSVDENMQFAATSYGLTPDAAGERIELLLRAADLTGARSRLASQLSGGMKRKLGFSMALAHQPLLLVIDEPSTGVDPVSRVELWKLISAAAADGAAVVMSTTYLDEAERATRLVVLDGGRSIASGAPADVIAGFTGTITLDGPQQRPEWSWRRGTSVHSYWPGQAPPPSDETGGQHAGDRSDAQPDLEDVVIALSLENRMGHESPAAARVPVPSIPHPGINTLPRADVPLAHARHLTKKFGAFIAVDDVTMQVMPGEIVGLLGANGAGKTTLLRMLLGLLAQTEGEVELLGGAPDRGHRHELGYVPQGLGLYGSLTARENLEFAASMFGVHGSALPADLAEWARTPVSRLPLGLQRQLAFACALIHSPKLLVLDEPTSGVDPVARARLWDTVHEQAERGIGVLVTTHYMQEAEQCDRLLLMSNGRLVASGSHADIVGSTTAVAIHTDDWAQAFRVLSGSDTPVALSGTSVRVADGDPRELGRILAAAGITATIEAVPATIEERMTILSRGA